MLRFTLIFAVAIASRETITGARFAASLARLAPCHEIDGFTVWPSNGFTVDYGREAGATVEFIAPLRRAVEFAADVCKYYGQDSVYLANGSDAVLVDYRGHVETLTGLLENPDTPQMGTPTVRELVPSPYSGRESTLVGHIEWLEKEVGTSRLAECTCMKSTGASFAGVSIAEFSDCNCANEPEHVALPCLFCGEDISIGCACGSPNKCRYCGKGI